MRFRLSVLVAVGLVFAAAPAFAEVSGSGGNSSHAGGTSVSSGSSESSASISSNGGGSVGVVQGNVAGGSSASGSSGTGSGTNSSGSSSSGAGVSGQSVGAVQPTALENGVVSSPKLPALDIVGSSQSAKTNRPDVMVWAIAALIVGVLVVLYRRLPRPSAS